MNSCDRCPTGGVCGICMHRAFRDRLRRALDVYSKVPLDPGELAHSADELDEYLRNTFGLDYED